MSRIFVSHEMYEAIINNPDGLVIETSGEPFLEIKVSGFGTPITADAITKELSKVRHVVKNGPDYFFTSGTGLPCKIAIEYFKDCGDVIVVDRKDRKWKKGELLKEADE